MNSRQIDLSNYQKILFSKTIIVAGDFTHTKTIKKQNFGWMRFVCIA